jgi:putative membrane-bound dehydrogenase-like protein
MKNLAPLLAGLLILFSACKQTDPRLADSPATELNFALHYDSLLYLPQGWTSTLWAESPQLYNPTNMDVDHRGRIWVTEAVNYRDFNNKPGKFPHFDQGDRVMILEDTDGDGKADNSKIFVQDKDLVAPLGIAVIGNKLLVSCAPNLIVYTDEDGDDRPDKKEIFLTGFGGFDHDHSLHAVVAGPDGNWYFNTGNAGPHTVTDKSGWTLRSGSLYTGGTPYNRENSGNRKSDDGRLWVGGLALRIHPDGTKLEVLAHNFRNAYELAVDSYGDLWQNDNDDQVETCRSTWLMYGGNAGYFSADGTRSWQADRRPGQSIFAAHWHQDDPGVIPVGDNTGAGSPTGVLVYEGDAFGEQYRGMFLNVDAGRNAIFAYQPRMQGAGFALERKDLITSLPESTEGYIWHKTSTDQRKWFRPSDMVVGPDGAFYIADWFDPVVGGHQMHDTTAYGRIYRIAPADRSLTVPELDLSTIEGQIAALCSPAVNVRYLGFEKLREQPEEALPAVKKLLTADNPFHRARAVWLLSQLGTEGKNTVEKLLREAPDPRLRIAAYRALVQQVPDQLLAFAEVSADDPSAAVRRAVAVSLRDAKWEDSRALLRKLYEGFDGADRFYLEALGIALAGKEAEFYQEIRTEEPEDPLQWSDAFAGLAWRLHPEAALSDLQTRALSNDLTNAERLRALTAIGFIPGKPAAETMMAVLDGTDYPQVQKMAEWWLQFRASNLWFEEIGSEAQDGKEELPEAIIAAEATLRKAGENAESLRQAALTLAAHPEGGKLLLNLAAAGKLPELLFEEAGLAQKLFANPEREVRVLAGEFFTRAGGPNLSIQRITALEGRADRGQKLFETNCSTCHKIGDTGLDIGPDLKYIRQKFDRVALTDAILNPSGAIAFGYEPVLIKTNDDQMYSGFLLSEGKETTVVKDIAGKQHTIRTASVQEKSMMNTSLMPDPVGMGLQEQDLADVVAYLMAL